MVDLNDRNMCEATCCSTCRFCKLQYAYNWTTHRDDYANFCVLGLDSHDRQYILNELEKFGLLNPEDGVDQYTTKFMQLMQMPDDNQDIFDCPRYVESDWCCDKFEPNNFVVGGDTACQNTEE